MLHRACKVVFWVPYPATALPAGLISKAGNAPLAHYISHGLHHGLVSVGHAVGHDARRKMLSDCPRWTAGARPLSIPARAAALMLHKDASGLRALGLTPASLLRTAHASLPVPRSHRAPAGQGQNQRRGRRTDGLSKRCERSLSVRTLCARAPAPDRRPIPSLRSVIPRSAVGRASRSREAPHQSRLGALLPLSLVGTRSCFSRDRFSQRWGASFAFRRLGAAHHFSPALGGPAQTFADRRKGSCCIRSDCWGSLRSASRLGLQAFARNFTVCFSQLWTYRICGCPNHSSIRYQISSRSNQSSCQSLN